MPNVNDGLTIEGEPAEAVGPDFAAQLAEQASGRRNTTESSVGAEPVGTRADPGADTPQEIAAALTSDDSNPITVRAGLVIDEEKSALPRYAPAAAEQAELDRLHAENARRDAVQAAETQAGIEARQELAIREFSDDLAGVETPRQLYGVLANLRGRVTEDQFDEALFQVACQTSGVWDLEETDPYLLELRSEAFRELEEGVGLATAENALRESIEMEQQLRPVISRQIQVNQQAAVREWMREQGLKPAAAQERLSLAEDAARQHYGRELETITDPREFRAVLHAADAVVQESVRALQERDFQQRLLDAPSTSVRDGIQQFTPFGWVGVNDVNLTRERGLPMPDPERTAARAIRKRVATGDIKRAVGSSEITSVRDGFTSGGKPTTIDVVSGARERYEQKRKDDIARARGLL